VEYAVSDTVLILRVCDSNRQSRGGFQWPASGPVEAPDWDHEPVCGFGLHGWLWGEGDASVADWDSESKWLVAEVESATLVDLKGKVKFPRAVVVHCGDKESATRYIAEHGAAGRAIIAGTATAGDRDTATAGDRGTATAGDRGTATAGDRDTATAGDRGTATAGDRGTATAGDRGTATAGYRGTATAGDRGTATAGDRGTATAGYRGTATAGDEGTATAGDEGTIKIRWWDGSANRYRWAIGYVGEDGIRPRVAYRVSDKKLVPVDAATTSTGNTCK
jgi:hypothetical protein